MILNFELLFQHLASYSPSLTSQILGPNTQDPYPNDAHIPCTIFYHLRSPPLSFYLSCVDPYIMPRKT